MEVDRTNDNTSIRVLSYTYQLNKGLDGLRTHSMLKELRMAQELRMVQEDRRKETNTSSNLISKPGPRLDVDLFGEARRCIGLYPVKARHILDFHEGAYEMSAEDIPQQHELRNLAAKEFLNEELKWNEEVEFKTNWSQERNILWLTLKDENLVSSIFKRQAVVKNDRIKLLKYIPHWCYDRNKELEILCRMEREKDKDLRTKVLIGHRDLKLCIKKKGDMYYKRVSVEYFGSLPGFNFTKIAEMSPGSPPGRKRSNSEGDEEGEGDGQPRGVKRKDRSVSTSPTRPDATNMRLEDVGPEEQGQEDVFK